MKSVYLETTVPSYLTAKPSRDLIVNAHQRITRIWWETARSRYRLVISEAVVEEAGKGNPRYAKKRLVALRGLEVLRARDDMEKLLRVYRRKLGLSWHADVDLLHIAFAVSYRLDYLVTWNCTHIANGEIIQKLIKINDRLGWVTPIIVTPEALLENPGEIRI